MLSLFIAFFSTLLLRYKAVVLSILLILVCTSPLVAIAQKCSPEKYDCIDVEELGVRSQINRRYDAGVGTLSSGNVQSIMTHIISMLLIIIPTIAVLMIAVGGVLMSTSGGDQSKYKRGTQMIMVSLTSVVVAFSAFFIVRGVQWLVVG
jgi:NADH:ubiquinone oxidoreductase subunit 3 (subunit A)